MPLLTVPDDVPSIAVTKVANVLTPIESADPTGALLATLSAWLDAAGSAQDAARRLGIHRHTVRNRLDRIAALTGRALDQPAQRYELWLALAARG